MKSLRSTVLNITQSLERDFSHIISRSGTLFSQSANRYILLQLTEVIADEYGRTPAENRVCSLGDSRGMKD